MHNKGKGTEETDKDFIGRKLYKKKPFHHLKTPIPYPLNRKILFFSILIVQLFVDNEWCPKQDPFC